MDDVEGEWWMIRRSSEMERRDGVIWKGNGGYYKEVDPHHRPLELWSCFPDLRRSFTS